MNADRVIQSAVDVDNQEVVFMSPVPSDLTAAMALHGPGGGRSVGG